MPVDWVSPMLLSVRVAVVATLVVACVATIASWAMRRFSFAGKLLLDTLLTLPMVVPPTVTGFVLLMLLGKNGPVGRFLEAFLGIRVVFTWWAAVIASAVVAFPLMYGTLRAGLDSIDESLEKAGRTLGASEARVFFTITLPLAWPSFVAGALLAFMRALGEFGATLMVAGSIPGRTLTMPTAIYVATESGDMRSASLLVAVMLSLGFGATYLSRVWSERQAGRFRRARRS
ncbi:MAG: molybdate ABC transporter permease subunit [Firmicutes bacterium]|jgi:molybdate transport system permease protein|nr:molybdate ABC transporter permease subunit [Bacillota bacterium]MDH7496373.1 molybdate ABC transporter permease subunit [Bacillota bacterium]